VVIKVVCQKNYNHNINRFDEFLKLIQMSFPLPKVAYAYFRMRGDYAKWVDNRVLTRVGKIKPGDNAASAK